MPQRKKSSPSFPKNPATGMFGQSRIFMSRWGRSSASMSDLWFRNNCSGFPHGFPLALPKIHVENCGYFSGEVRFKIRAAAVFAPAYTIYAVLEFLTVGIDYTAFLSGSVKGGGLLRCSVACQKIFNECKRCTVIFFTKRVFTLFKKILWHHW